MTTGRLRGLRGGKLEGRDIKLGGHPTVTRSPGTCLPIENWQYKTVAEITSEIGALKLLLCDRDYVYPDNCRKYYACDQTGSLSPLICSSNWLFRLVKMFCYI